MKVIPETYLMKVIPEMYLMKVISENVPDEGYFRNVPDEGYFRNVPDEGYFRKAPCVLNLISTFLFIRTRINNILKYRSLKSEMFKPTYLKYLCYE